MPCSAMVKQNFIYFFSSIYSHILEENHILYNMKRKKNCLLAAMLCFIASFCPAEEMLSLLLAGYLRNSLELQKLSAEAQKQLLAQKSTEISNGFSFSISSGTIRIRPGSDSYVTFEPSASISIPQASNLKFTISTSMRFDDDDTNRTFSTTKLSASIDLYSDAMQKRKITLLKAERSVLEARRKLQDGYLSAEKDFYTSIKKLYNTAIDITTAQKDLYDDQLSLETLKAQGYKKTSPKYRSANMKVLSDQRSIQIKQRELERETKIFASKCGVSYDGSDALSFLPRAIPDVQAVDVLSFGKENYAGIESAVWTKHINELSREADKTVNISANAGYTFNNDIADSDTVDAGATFKWHDTGLNVTTGVSIPVEGEDKMPIYSLGLSFTPNPFRLAKISEQEKQLDKEQEDIAIKSAENSYDTSVISQQTALEDLLWTRKTNEELYDMYVEQEKELAKYFKSGVITESEYRSAQVNKENYHIKLIINAIDVILYNQETTLLFHRDEELYNGREKQN